MKLTDDGFRLVLPPSLLAQVEAAAGEEHRSVADVVRELIERGLDERRWRSHAEKEWRRARDLGLTDRSEIDQDRQSVAEKIGQGAGSLRDGRVVDGGAFMAQMEAELAEAERQGR